MNLSVLLTIAGKVVPVLEHIVSEIATGVGGLGDLSALVADVQKLLADLKAKLNQIEGLAGPSSPPAA